MFPGYWQIAIVVVLVVLLFGRGKISSLMGDVAKGIKSFKKGLSDDNTSETTSDSESVDKTDDNENSNKN
jgi:sec-independent protein translocase protein TatA